MQLKGNTEWEKVRLDSIERRVNGVVIVTGREFGALAPRIRHTLVPLGGLPKLVHN